MVHVVNLQIQYAQDCKAVYGKILGAPVPEARFMVAATETTIQLWNKHFPMEPYHHTGLSNSGTEEEEIGNCGRRINYDLVDAVLRQSSFYYQVRTRHILNLSTMSSIVVQFWSRASTLNAKV